MNKKSLLIVATSIAGLMLFGLFHKSQSNPKSYNFVDWYHMGVYAKEKISAGSIVHPQNVEEKPLNLKTDNVILKGNIKSIGSASDRPTKRDIEQGELLMYKDLGEQPYVFGRPHPETEIY
jgi:hypothetical protein